MSTGIATLGVAAFPLDVSSTIDTVHGALATIGYATLAATPLLAARPLAESGHREAAALSLAAGVIAGLSLAATVLGPAHGLFQRIGLTTGDIWLAASAVAMFRPCARQRQYVPSSIASSKARNMMRSFGSVGGLHHPVADRSGAQPDGDDGEPQGGEDLEPLQVADADDRTAVRTRRPCPRGA